LGGGLAAGTALAGGVTFGLSFREALSARYSELFTRPIESGGSGIFTTIVTFLTERVLATKAS
jgi:hypothetical protein